MMDEELVIASSPADAGISFRELHSGAERLRHHSCPSTPHGIALISNQFIASSQLRDSKTNSGSIFYWWWNKPRVEVKSFPSEIINTLVASEGTHLTGGGFSGNIFSWEFCLVLCDDRSSLVSGMEDECVRIWSLVSMLDYLRGEKSKHIYEYSFSEHSLIVTDIVTGYGGCNAIIVSASEDRTCKVL